jgi:hypothetical protein
MPELLASDGLLAKLQGEGYRVIAPDADEQAPDAANSTASP